MRSILNLALCGALATAAWASTLEKLTVDDLVQKSTAVARGKVMGSSCVQRGSVIYTVYRLQVSEWIKGAGVVGGTTEVYVPGGTFNGYRQSFAGSPTLDPGVDYVVFLWTSPKGITQVIGLGQGVFQVKVSSTGESVLSRGPVDADFVDSTGKTVEDQGAKFTMRKLQDLVRATRTEVR